MGDTGPFPSLPVASLAETDRSDLTSRRKENSRRKKKARMMDVEDDNESEVSQMPMGGMIDFTPQELFMQTPMLPETTSDNNGLALTSLPENMPPGVGFSVQLANLLSDNPMSLADLARSADKATSIENPSQRSFKENYSYPNAISEIPIPL